ncbi:MAG: type II toxin-antitoxin system RelE/ParE family toxin [Proteobacteria bacterium]|nr:type II toxin-antitoxin system RelE/ParE family toxin [Pseudomonadota bacterium]
MKILTTRHFSKWAKKQKVSTDNLATAAEEVRNGNYEANLGGNVIKKRMPFHGKGKRGGIRTIIFYKQHDKLIFVHGFQKNEQSDISDAELKGFKELAKIFMSMSEHQFQHGIKIGNFMEIVK